MNMRTSRLLAATAILVSVAIVSCKRGETVIRTYDSEVEHVLEQSDSAGVTVSQGVEYLETFEGGKTLCAKINNLIVRFCYGDEYDGVDLAQASKEYADRLVEDYKKDAGETYEADEDSPWIFNWAYTITGSFAESYGDLQTYMVYSENYLGGAHGMQALIPHVINLKTGEEVEEDMMFIEGYEEPVSELIKAALQKDWGSPDDPGSTYCMMEEDGMVPNGYWGVSEEGITWYFQPYVIASYAQGVVEAKVPWHELRPYLDRDAIKL